MVNGSRIASQKAGNMLPPGIRAALAYAVFGLVVMIASALVGSGLFKVFVNIDEERERRWLVIARGNDG